MNNAARDFRSNLIAAGVHLDTVNLTARVCLEGTEDSWCKQLVEARAKHEVLPRGASLDPTIDWLPVADSYLNGIGPKGGLDPFAFTPPFDTPIKQHEARQRQKPVRAYGESELSERAHFLRDGRRIDQQTIEAILNTPRLAKKETQRICDAITEIGQRSWSFMAEANKKNSAILQRRFKKALGHNRHNRRFANNSNKPKRHRQAWQ